MTARRSAAAVAAILFALAAAAASPAAPAQAKKGAPVPPPAPVFRGHPDSSSWTPLFKADLSDAVFPAGVWTVEEGVLTASADQAIWSGGEHEDFVLDLEFKTAPGTNSGVVAWCTDTENWIPNSVEVQICDDFAEEWASQPGTWHCGAIFGHLAPAASAVRAPGEWNRMTIECRAAGRTIDVTLNGTLVTHMDMAKWTSGRKNPDGSEIPSWLPKPFATLPTRGRIGLQGKHADAPVWFRNVRIKDLPPAG